MLVIINDTIKIPRPSFQAVTVTVTVTHNFNVFSSYTFIFVLLLPEGQADEAWEPLSFFKKG